MQADPPLETTPAPPTLLARRVVARLIDDALLITFMIMLVLLVFRKTGSDGNGFLPSVGIPGMESAWTAYAPLSDDDGGDIGLAIFLGSLLCLLLLILYVAVASMTRGVTVGRLMTGLRVVAADGRPAADRIIAGRELIRMASVALALTFLSLVSWPLVGPGGALFGRAYTGEVGQVSAVAGAFLPLAFTAAGLIGAAMVHPDGRALHDRWSRTKVVRAGAVPQG